MLGDGKNLLANFRCNPAENAVEGEEVKFAEILVEAGKVTGHGPHVLQITCRNIFFDCRNVIRVDIDTNEFALWVGGGKGCQ